MSFDIALLDTYTGSVQGVEMPLRHPRTGEPLHDSRGRPVFIKVYGRHHPSVKATVQAISRRRMLTGDGGSEEESVQDEVDIAVAATAGWSFDKLDGEDFLYSVENARRLYSDPRFGNIRSQVVAFVLNEGNFTKL